VKLAGRGGLDSEYRSRANISGFDFVSRLERKWGWGMV